MSTETVRTLKQEILKLKKDLNHEKQRYDNLYRTTLEISNDFMKYAEKYHRNSSNDGLDMIKINYDDVESLSFD